MDHFRSGLGIGQAQFARLDVHILPFQRRDFPRRQPVSISRRMALTADLVSDSSSSTARRTFPRAVNSSRLRKRPRFSSTYFLTCRQGLLPSGRRPQIFGEVEHLGEHAEGSISLVGSVAQAVVQFGDILAFDVRHLAGPDLGIDEQFDGSLVFRLGARLASHGDMFFEESFAQSLHRRGLARLIEFLGGGRGRPWPRREFHERGCGPVPA